ncbi:MAG: hypothetical protein R3C68_09565 [Myxococcota bacterium]
MRTFLLLSALVSVMGCEKIFHGTGQLYIWNGSQTVVKVEASGSTPVVTVLQPESGHLFRDVTSGEYSMRVLSGSKSTSLAGKINKDALTVLNVDKLGCFARANIIGMYQKGKEPVEVTEVYRGQLLIRQQGVIDVLPGEPMPVEAPRKPYAYLRFVVIPCDLVSDDSTTTKENVAQYVRRLR